MEQKKLTKESNTKIWMGEEDGSRAIDQGDPQGNGRGVGNREMYNNWDRQKVSSGGVVLRNKTTRRTSSDSGAEETRVMT